jgi:hypothetical protein
LVRNEIRFEETLAVTPAKADGTHNDGDSYGYNLKTWAVTATMAKALAVGIKKI